MATDEIKDQLDHLKHDIAEIKKKTKGEMTKSEQKFTKGVILYETVVNEETTDALVKKYSYLVHKKARSVANRVPPNVQLDDLVQAGMEGLLQAIGNYSNAKGVDFEAYAHFRINGAIIDFLRKGDMLSRTTRQQFKQISEAINEMKKTLGREPRNREVARAVNMSMEQYDKIINDANTATPVSYDSGSYYSSIMENHNSGANDLEEYVSYREKEEILTELLKTLPLQQTEVFEFYFVHGLTLREIAFIIEKTEARVSQILKEAVSSLHAAVDKFLGGDSGNKPIKQPPCAAPVA